MCRFTAGFKGEEDYFLSQQDLDTYTKEDAKNPAVKMMDNVMSMLFYKEYVPMPMCAAPNHCPTWDKPMIYPRKAPSVEQLTAALASTGLEDAGVTKSDLSGWEISMNEDLSESETLFLGSQTLFLGDEKAKDCIVFASVPKAEKAEAGLFLRSVSPSLEQPNKAWSNLDELDNDWVIA